MVTLSTFILGPVEGFAVSMCLRLHMAVLLSYNTHFLRTPSDPHIDIMDKDGKQEDQCIDMFSDWVQPCLPFP